MRNAAWPSHVTRPPKLFFATSVPLPVDPGHQDLDVPLQADAVFAVEARRLRRVHVEDAPQDAVLQDRDHDLGARRGSHAM